MSTLVLSRGTGHPLEGVPKRRVGVCQQDGQRTAVGNTVERTAFRFSVSHVICPSMAAPMKDKNIYTPKRNKSKQLVTGIYM